MKNLLPTAIAMVFAFGPATALSATQACDSSAIGADNTYANFEMAGQKLYRFKLNEKDEFESTAEYNARRIQAVSSLLPFHLSQTWPIGPYSVYDADEQVVSNLQVPNEFNCSAQCAATLDLFPDSATRTTFVKLAFVGIGKEDLFPPIAMATDKAREVLQDRFDIMVDKKYGFRWSGILDPIEPFYESTIDNYAGKTHEIRTFYVKVRCSRWSVENLG